MARGEDSSASVIATQIPTDLTRRQIEENFSVVGPVKKCHLVRDKDGVFKGVAYIVYSILADAKEAVDKLNNSTLNEKIIKVKLTRQRDNEGANTQVKSEESTDQEKGKKKKLKDKNQKSKANRKGRIIIRNLSFKADEKAIEDHFSQYGKISEVSILRKKDGKMVGCAFVQFNMKKEALKAIKECNMKPLLGRPIAVDLAVPKEKFSSVNVKKEDPEAESPTQVKLEYPTQDTHEDESYENVKIKEEKHSSDIESGDSGLEDDSDSEVENEAEDEEASTANKKPFSDGPSRDVAEERTLFIKNLSYEATEEDIKNILEQYGALKYVLLCIDQMTQHPRGTAFAQFLEREAADNCLEAEKNPSTKHLFTLHGRPMHIMRAISRKELQQRKNEDKETVPKDKRNLYLAREGFVREGTQSAVGVSKADMALRIKREQVKRRMLRNLHIFVSPTRLCINNLPQTLTDKGLGKVFKKYAPKEAVLTESRVMKDLRNLDENGKPASRGYGFVSFTKHEHALAALRKVNNNPEVFTHEQRPIVEFSLENRSVLKAREKRMEKSKEKNPLWKMGNDKTATPKTDCSVDQNKHSKQEAEPEDESYSNFMGAKSNPTRRDLPGNIGPKIRHNRKNPGAGKISRKQLRKQQRDRALGKKRKRPHNEELADSVPSKKSKGEETENQPKKKKNKKLSKRMKIELKSEKSFQSMVQNYKKKMLSVNSTSDKKWYED